MSNLDQSRSKAAESVNEAYNNSVTAKEAAATAQAAAIVYLADVLREAFVK